MFDRIKSIFQKEKWPEGKTIKWVISQKDYKKDSIIYLTDLEVLNLMIMLNLGTQLVQQSSVIAKIQPETTKEFIQ